MTPITLFILIHATNEIVEVTCHTREDILAKLEVHLGDSSEWHFIEPNKKITLL